MLPNDEPVCIKTLLEHLSRLQGSGCPNCEAGCLAYNGQHGTIGQSFSKWEEKSGKTIPPVVRNQYDQALAYYLFECQRCGFGTFCPSISGTTEYYEAIADKSYYEGVKDEFIRVIDFISQHNIGSLLEVGAGNGFFLRFLKERIPAVARFACEKNPSTLDELALVASVHADFESLGRKFDAVCAFQLLEHLEEPFDFIEACRRVLAQSGYLFISVPDYCGPYRFYGDSWTETPPHHLTRWTPRSLRSLLVRRGFSDTRIVRLPLRSAYFPSYVPLLWWQLLRSMRLEKKIWLLNRGKGIASLLQRLGIERLPFVPMVLLAFAKKD